MIRRSSFVLALASAALTVTACDCSDGKTLPGPAVDSFEELSATRVQDLGIVPFDVDRRDLSGPNSHDSNYGKTPEIVVAPGDGYFDAVVRGTDETNGPNAVLVRVREDGGALELEKAFSIPTLGLVLGFVRAADGSYYYATGAYDDDISQSYPSKNQHRSNVVRVYHAAANGEILFDVDLDPAREESRADSEPLVNPGVASSARLGLTSGQLALVAGNNTAPDSGGTRHQKAVTTVLDPATGAVTATSSIWCSHSFDERYLSVGEDLYETHLGDAYPRQIVTTRIRGASSAGAFPAYFVKGQTGDNVTRTRLGMMAQVNGGDDDGAFVILFSTERTTGTEGRIAGARDLALVRLVPDFADGEEDEARDESLGGTTWDVTSGGESATNRAVFLTNYDAGGTADHVERPKLVALAGGELLALYEHWTWDGSNQAFEGTYAMRLDATGAILAGPTRLTAHHLPRGDDAFAYGGGIAWLSGDETTRELTLHRVSSALVLTETVVP